MKKLILILLGILSVCVLSIILLVGCTNDPNKGYGYNTKTEIPVQTTPENNVPQKKTLAEKAAEREMVYGSTTMTLYSTTGKRRGYSDAYKGEFDGHEFYVFMGPDKMSVIPVAMVEYYENLMKEYETQQVYNPGEGW